MYGLIFENFSGYVKIKFGEETWDQCRRLAGVETPTFGYHTVYPEQLFGKVAKKTFTTLGINDQEFFEGMGYYFIEFATEAGYGDILALLGRQLRDLLMGMDNLHEYLKFSYPRLRGPSFYVDEETPEGLKLFYRSKRRGFANYVKGQLAAIGETYFKKELGIELKDQEIKFDTVQCTFVLSFQNNTETKMNSDLVREEARLPAVSSAILFDIFPFIIIFGPDMIITNIGRSMTNILPKIVGKAMNAFFDIVRPLVEFSFEMVLARSNNIFEVMTNEPIEALLATGGEPGGEEEGGGDDENLMEEEVDKSLHMKGQMSFNPDWNVVMFLGSPAIADLNSMQMSGLFICDLAMHDFSRDLLLASGQQQAAAEDITADQEKAEKMEVHLKEAEVLQKDNDELMSLLVPKAVAKLLKEGASYEDTQKTFESVTVVMSDVFGMNELCASADGMSLAAMVTNMFNMFIVLTNKHDILNVDNVRDVATVAAGIPTEIKTHAEKAMDVALDMKDAAAFVIKPGGGNVQVRISAYSGKVVGGIVGIKIPRYCVFGEPIIVCKHMMQHGQSQMILIGEVVKAALPPSYTVNDKGKVAIEGKGQVMTYWCANKANRVPPTMEELSGALKDDDEEEAPAEAAPPPPAEG